jgi:hypothetical protein
LVLIFYEKALTLDLTKKGPSKIIRTRIWGFYKNLTKAKKCVVENWTDIYENGYYNYALINAFAEGVCVTPLKQHWFKVTYLKGKNIHKVTACANPLLGDRMNIGW